MVSAGNDFVNTIPPFHFKFSLPRMMMDGHPDASEKMRGWKGCMSVSWVAVSGS
jgi:hypothetical protein